MGLAFAWGLAESTFFFFVPDVLSSRFVLQNARHGFLACFASLAGALLGGLIVFKLGSDAALNASLLSAMTYLPGINTSVIETARLNLAHHGAGALFAGMLTGIPYKLYALQAPPAGVNLGLFMLVSIGARLSRFLIVTTSIWLIGRTMLAKLSATTRLRIHAAGWFTFYAVYFWRMRG